MGLSHSRAHPRVTKVAPLQNKEEEPRSAGPVDVVFNQKLEEKSSYSFTRLQDRSKALEGQLPPLRETWYGRYSAVPRAMYFDIPLEQGETSIIKRHPPRRLQQESEKKMQTPIHTSGKRQYLHKMQMLEMNRKRQEAQVELKKSLHREARINKQNLRDHKAKKILQSIPINDGGELLTLLPDETLNRSLGNSQNAELLEHQARNDCCPRKIGKMETWLREQEARGQLLGDSSSSDSDEVGKVEKKPRALVRTRTERIPLFDEFFDRE
uniref:Coiled-coil domain containing 198 n=1 Tax=Equus caballus TaxID=9796 RepID=A0A9L0R152_HORSE